MARLRAARCFVVLEGRRCVDGKQGDVARGHAVPASDQCVAELVEDDEREQEADEQHAEQRRVDRASAEVVGPRDPSDQEEERRVHTDVDPGETSDLERPLHRPVLPTAHERGCAEGALPRGLSSERARFAGARAHSAATEDATP
jgi:hypothetical protein